MSPHNLNLDTIYLAITYSTGKPYLGVLNSDKKFQFSHGLSKSQVLARIVDLGLPFLFACHEPIEIGAGAVFFNDTHGTVTRLVEREEFLDWEKKVFGRRIRKTMLDENDKFFCEVKVD